MKKWITSKYFYKLLVSFLLIGVVPLLIIGPIAYALTKSILYKRVYNQSEIFIQAVDESFRDAFDASLSMMNSIMEDDAFETLFHFTEEDGRVYLYEALYTLLSTQKNRPSIHIVNADFDVVMSTDPTPKEYYQKAYRSWGVMRKALLAKGNPVTYYYTISSDETRVVTLARAKYAEDGELEGVVFVDHHEEGLRDLIPLVREAPQQSVILLDEFFNRILTLKGTVEDHVFKQIVGNLNHVGAFLQSEMEHPSCMYTLVRNDVLGYAILLYYPLAQVEELLRLIAMVFIIVAGVMTGMSVVLALYVSRNAAKPLSQVVNVLQKVSHGDFSARTDIDRKDEFGNLGLSVNDMVVRMKHLIDTNRQKEQSLRTSEIKSLMCQTNPHFIFNCLETIKWYILLGDTKEASESVVELGSLLRSSLDLGEGIITVQEEIGFIEKYLLLQKRRLGNRMRVKFEIDPDILSIRIPRFLFQPIVENAIMHGLENKMGQGELLIKCYEESSVLHVIVKDNGLGMSEELARKMSSYREMNEVTEGGTGLQNLVRRLNLYYGDAAGIRIHSTPMKGTQVNIDINLMVGL